MIVVCVAVGAGGAFAQPAWRNHGGADPEIAFSLSGPYARAELDSIRSELGEEEFGDLTLARLAPYWTRLNLALSKDQYLERASTLSMILPGAGQFENGETSSGVGFLSLHLAAVTGTLAGFYFLLPADLRFDRLDYLDTSFRDIRDAWEAHSFNDYLPSIGALVAGTLLDLGIRCWASNDAYAGARSAVESGKAELKPAVGPGFLGVGVSY
jgi:hypothetical protein